MTNVPRLKSLWITGVLAFAVVASVVSVGTLVWVVGRDRAVVTRIVTKRVVVGGVGSLSSRAYHSGAYTSRSAGQASEIEPGGCRWATVSEVDPYPPRAGDIPFVTAGTLPPLGVVIVQPVLVDPREVGNRRWGMTWSWCNVSSAAMTWQPGVWHYYAFH